jgi:hypothetical protein
LIFYISLINLFVQVKLRGGYLYSQHERFGTSERINILQLSSGKKIYGVKEKKNRD